MSSFRAFRLSFVILAIVALTYGQNYYHPGYYNYITSGFISSRPVCNAIVSSLTPNQQYEIVNLHNQFRRKVAAGYEYRGYPGPQPAAEYMPDLVWDTELAYVAQNWANQCKLAHDNNRHVQRFQVGQNVGKSWTTDSSPLSIKDMITMWYDEVRFFNRNLVEHYIYIPSIGHYSQMIWASTTSIGCGYVNYLNGHQNTALLVCNYGPTGNVNRGRMYEIRR